MGERIRGRKGVALRLARLARQPWCQDCRAKGIDVLAVTPDHIIPLAKGGEDVDSNTRNLCQPCHDRRTAEQFGMGKIVRKRQISIDGWPVEE